MGFSPRGREEELHRQPAAPAAKDISQLILAYHAVSSGWPSGLAIPERTLRAQLSLLKGRGYASMTFRELERRRELGSLPHRSVVITFDDGYASTMRAKPILDELGYTATVFPVLRFVESGEPLCWPGIENWRHSAHRAELEPLSWEQLEQLVEGGWEVGSHTVGHRRLPELSDQELAAQLRDSRGPIAERLGDCDTVAYPYGDGDERVASVAAPMGYLAGCTLTRFHLVDAPHLRPRIGLYDGDEGRRLRLKLSPLAQLVRRSSVAATLLGGD